MVKSAYINIWLVLFLIGVNLASCDRHNKTLSQEQVPSKIPKSNYADSIKLLRTQQNLKFKNPTSSPLEKDSINSFTRLRHYAVKEKWRIKSQFTLINSPEIIEMPTTTERIIKMAVYGKFDFSVSDTPCSLLAFQDITRRDGIMFIPFLDQTNGFDTYGGGRYLDVAIPNNDSAYLDFNMAYNPYCAYNMSYSCPIPPLENTLNVAIAAGEKQLYKH